MSYNVRQGVDIERVLLLLIKWPIYAFKLLRRGRFATIAELRRDAYHLKNTNPRTRLSRSDSQDLSRGIRSTIGNPKAALSWAFFIVLVLIAERFVPQLRPTIAALLVGSCMTAIIVALSSIVRESKVKNQEPGTFLVEKSTDQQTIISNMLGGLFFVASTFPFAIPWVLAFFFPRECLLFFATWAIFGAIINEVSVLVAHARVAGDQNKKKNDDITIELVPTESNNNNIATAPTIRKRKRKTTAQRIATVMNFTIDDRKDLEEYIVSDEGLKWWAAFLAMQATISGLAIFLRLITDMYISSPIVVSFTLIMSMCMLCESFWMTYAAGGRWLHFRKKWKFFQPLKGGQKFFTMQIAAWLLFFIFLIKTMADLRKPSRQAFVELNEFSDWGRDFLDQIIFDTFERLSLFFYLNHLPTGSVAVCGAVAELLMLVSLPLFEGPRDEMYLFENKNEAILDHLLNEVVSDETLRLPLKVLPTESSNPQDEDKIIDPDIVETVQFLKKKRIHSEFSVSLWEMVADAVRTAWLSPIVLTLVKPEVTLFLTGFLMTKFIHGTSFFGLFNIHLPYVFILIIICYIPTYFGNPRKTGRRRWLSLRGTWVYDELSAYWYTNIIRERELNEKEKHIFGYHPHGMFPMGASYLHNTSQWMDLFPNILPYTLMATITHIVPLLREVTQYNGGLEVTENNFFDSLNTFRNVLLVPGGQHEMLLFSNDPQEYLLSTKHRGFFRIALLSKAENPTDVLNLVPIYVFGESDMLYNAMPVSLSLQRWMVAKLRLNPAFLPVGRFNLAGVPKRTPVTFVVGTPIPVPLVNGIPTEEQITILARRYFTAVQETFEKHKQLCYGFENARISFEPSIDLISKLDFEMKWKEIENDSKGPLSDFKRRKDPFPLAEYAIAIMLGNLCLWTPYFFFATS